MRKIAALILALLAISLPTLGEDGDREPNGRVTFVVDATGSRVGPRGDLKSVTHLEVALPATIRIKEGEDFRLDWDDQQAALCSMSVTGTFSWTLDGTQNEKPLHAHAAVPIKVGSGTAQGSSTRGSIEIPKGAKRPYWQPALTILGVQSTEGIRPNPGGALSLDDGIEDGPFSPLANVPEQYRALKCAALQKEVAESGRAAKCVFDGAAFKKSFQVGKPFTQALDYSYVLKKENPEETSVLEMKVRLEIQLK
jgi:hypothetical protein